MIQLYRMCGRKHISVTLQTLRSQPDQETEETTERKQSPHHRVSIDTETKLGANYKKILRLSYDVIITYDNRKSNLR